MVTAINPATVNAAVKAQTGSKITSDFDTFLKLLTAQMKNQDPLNPIDSTDYATQLATFSGVEQQIKTNDLLGALSGQMSVLGMSQLAAWVGQEARAAGPVWVGENPVTLSIAPATGADRAILVVRNQTGTVVTREDVPNKAGNYDWSGLGSNGQALPKGLYSLSLESYVDENLVKTADVESYARIIEARNGVKGSTLVLEGGVEVGSDKITALRVPPY